MRDRLGELDGVLASETAPREAIERAYRSVHSMKGAASSVGDDTTAWYCHGLEARLKKARDDEQTATRRGRASAPSRGPGAASRSTAHTLGHVARQRQRAAWDAQHVGAVRSTRFGAPVPRTRRRRRTNVHRGSAARPRHHHRRFPGTATAPGSGAGRARSDRETGRQVATRLREMRASLLEALRLIGPPRPWGAPAAALSRIENAARKLGAAAENADRGASCAGATPTRSTLARARCARVSPPCAAPAPTGCSKRHPRRGASRSARAGWCRSSPAAEKCPSIDASPSGCSTR